MGILQIYHHLVNDMLFEKKTNKNDNLHFVGIAD